MTRRGASVVQRADVLVLLAERVHRARRYSGAQSVPRKLGEGEVDREEVQALRADDGLQHP